MKKKFCMLGVLLTTLNPMVYSSSHVEMDVSQSVDQQKVNIKGKVIDKNGEPLIGASVIEKGNQSNGTITDIDGGFSLNVAKDAVLQVSYVSYKTKYVTIKSSDLMVITLQEDTDLLEEVVVVGYGTQKKASLTGSVGTVQTEKALKSRPVTNVQELLAGSVPGLVVSKGSGAVGSGASINIHGTSTIGGSSGVLILIDGVPGNIYTLNPNDIENISVLKDAASAAIYGSRAANGVILVTTKRGRESEHPVVELSTNIGIQNPQFKLDFVGAEDYMKLVDQAMVNDGKDPIYGEQGLQDLKAGKYADNKWYKELYRSNTLINNSHIAISGKEKSITYRFSVSNDHQDGTLPHNTYNRLVLKPDMQIDLAKNLKFSTNLQYTITNVKSPQGGNWLPQNQSSRISPITPIYTSDGHYAIGGTMGGNPIAMVNEGGYFKERYKELLAIFGVVYTPLKNWNIKADYSAYLSDNTNKDRVKSYDLYDEEGNVARTENMVSRLTNSTSSSRRTQLQITSDYSLTLADSHHLKFLAGFSQEEFKAEGFWASRDNLPFPDIDVIGTGSSNKQNGNNATYETAIQSWFGRINYDYQGKYLFEASIRADGSSRFAKGHRWGVFPSFSAGWNIHREKFMEAASSWLSELKLRGSWGTLGDAEKVGAYPTAQVISYDPKIYGFNGKLVGGAFNNVSVNPNISWEVSELFNVGVDLGLWNQKLKFSVDYFNNLRRDILYAAPVPTEFGLGAPITNMLKMRNQGFDFILSYNDHSGDFNWGVDLTSSFSRNSVLNLGENERWIEGSSITNLHGQYQLPYGYESEGLFRDEDDVKNHAEQGNVLPGNIKFKDQNGDGKINGEDRVILNHRVPVNFGTNIHFGYKNFDFSMNMYGKLNFKRYISGYEGWAFYLSDNARPMHKDAWSPTNLDASYPRLTLTNTSNDTQYNDFWLRSANYLKIQNVQIGYTFPQSILDKIHLKYLRMYLSGQNLATITNYDGFDPEGSWYPMSRTFTFGVNVKF